MSVISQMKKDLNQRSHASQPVLTETQSESDQNRRWLLLPLVLTFISSLILYNWFVSLSEIESVQAQAINEENSQDKTQGVVEEHATSAINTALPQVEIKPADASVSVAEKPALEAGSALVKPDLPTVESQHESIELSSAQAVSQATTQPVAKNVMVIQVGAGKDAQIKVLGSSVKIIEFNTPTETERQSYSSDRSQSTGKTPIPGQTVRNGAAITVIEKRETKLEAQKQSVVPADLIPQDERPVTSKGKLEIEAVQLSPLQLSELYLKQARAAKIKGKTDQAIVKFNKSLSFQPGRVEVRKELAAILYGRGETKRAVTLLDQGLELAPEVADFRLMLARIAIKSGNTSQAFYYLDAMRPEVVSNMDYYATLAALAQQQGENSKALLLYQQLIDQQINQAKWWMGLGIAQEKSGQKQQALNAYRQAELLGGLRQSSVDYLRQRIEKLK